MELNGYGYVDFRVQPMEIKMPSYKTSVVEGEFILNLHDGRMQKFKPIEFNLHSPSEHSVNGEHFDLEVHILHYYKGTRNQLGAMIGIFFDVKKAASQDKDNAFIQSILDSVDNGGEIRILEFL